MADTAPNDPQRRATERSASPLADPTTPLIRNAWYVVATSAETTRIPLGREVMETSIVIFRSEAGTPIVLANRCCHRSFPLAHGTVEGDSLRCGYHGLRYDREGRCVEIPMQEKIPPTLRVRAYPAIERHPFIWVWFGDANAADPSLLPHPSWLGAPDWDMYSGYLSIRGSYVHLHENLLDLSHLSFLHKTTFGTPEYATAPVNLAVEGADIQVWRHVECELPDIYAVPLAWKGQRVLRSSGSQFVAPGLHVNTGILKNPKVPAAASSEVPTIKVAQLITPETKTRVHYWFAGCRNFARHRSEIDDFMRKAQFAAFAEDQFALEQITRMHEVDTDTEFNEAFLATDGAGIAMRRRLKAMADRER